MGALADAIYQRTIDDYESIQKRAKIRKFLGVGAGVAVAVGMTMGAISLSNLKNHEDNVHQERLKYMSEHPFVYDGGTVKDCKIQYIATAHKTETGTFQKANYMKSDCDGHVSINKIKEKIIHNRSKLLNDEKDVTNILNIK